MPESKSGALDQLGDAPVVLPIVSPFIKRVAFQATGDKAPHCRRQFTVQRERIFFPWKFGKHAGPGTRHARTEASPWTALPQPLQMLRDFRISARRDRLEIVAALPR